MSSILKVDTIQTAAGGTPTAADLGLNVSGSVLQVESLVYTDTFSQSITSGAINNLQLAITPKATNSKILVDFFVFFEANTQDHDINFHIMRDSTNLYAPVAGSRKSTIAMPAVGYFGDDNSSTPTTAQVRYIDSPNTTSQITYKLAVNLSSTKTIHFNKSVTDTDSAGFERGITTIVLTEIAG